MSSNIHRRLQLTLVDVDSKELISAWILSVTSSAPNTTRKYDVDILMKQPINKKIVFKNPWNIFRRFTLVSSDDLVMKPRIKVLEVAPYGSAFLRLWFNSAKAIRDRKDVFLFLNDESGQNEETFLFHVSKVE